MNFLLGLVPPRIALYVCAALLVISAVLGGWLWVTTQQRDVAIANNAALAASVKLQNRAVEDWKKKAAEQETRATAAEKKAAEEQAASRQRVERILASRVPSTCPEALRWGALEGALQAKEWEEKK